MDKLAMFEKKQWIFYVFVLLQAVLIFFTADYVANFVARTTQFNNFSARKEPHARSFVVKHEKGVIKFRRKSFKAFNVVVIGKRMLDLEDNQNGKSGKVDVLKTINESNQDNNSTHKNSNNISNEGNNETSNKHVNNSNLENRNINKNNIKNHKVTKWKKVDNSNIDNNGNNNKAKKNDNNSIKNITYKDDSNDHIANKHINNTIINNNDHRVHKIHKNAHHTSLTKQHLNDTRKSILMFIAIVSAPGRIQRRNALRRSWLRQCKRHNTSCYIFTDALDMYGERLPDDIHVGLEHERFLHSDLILAQSPGGINFATRYLWIMNWANAKYKFDFLLRVDDDYFLCIDRLFLELPFRRTVEKLYWGHVHCYPPGGIRVDEGFVIVSNDLIQHFIREEHKSLMCHPFGDQAMAMWINDVDHVVYFGDPRVHYEVSANEPILERHVDICAHFLALHGSYPVQIEKYWQRLLITPRRRYPVPEITYPCGEQDRKYSKTYFEGMYHADPIPCRDSPVWNISSVYVGRSGTLRS